MNKNRKNIYYEWISIITEIYNNLPDVPALTCPNCHKLGIDFQFIGDLQTKIGYMAIWCPFCLHGIHLSRVRIPDTTQAFSFDTSAEEISKRIPNFIHVKP
ncbi:MAG: hypothetical protein KI793_04080 [Rivularia sp. (in: Bacteria)]|nr:hypothetical protein [Rivularia sp. MS3]